jgi:hypothetical protein
MIQTLVQPTVEIEPARTTSAENTGQLTGQRRARGPLRRITLGLLLLLIAAALVAPFWTVKYPALNDYPNHLASAFVLAHLSNSTFHFNQFYAFDWNTHPYLAMDLILVALQRVMPVGPAGRVLLSLCALSVPASAWFFLRSANPRQESLAFWSLLVAHHFLFAFHGLINMWLSVGLCFVVLGLWLRYLERPRINSWLLLLVATTALYFTHLMGFGIAGLVMTLYALFARRRLIEMLLSWAVFIPGLLFHLRSPAYITSSQALIFPRLTDKALGLVSVIVTRTPALDFLTLLAIGTCVALARSRNSSFQWNRHWPRVVACLLVLYGMLPVFHGPYGLVDKRLLPVVFILALATVRVGRRARQLAIVGMVLFFARAGALEYRFISVQPHLKEMAQAFSVIPEDARVLPLVEGEDDMPAFWAYGVIERGWFSPCLFQGLNLYPLAMKLPTYRPAAWAIWPCSYEPRGAPRSLDWRRVQDDFDYVWAKRVPWLSAGLSTIGTNVYEDGDLQVFRLRRLTQGSQFLSNSRNR